MTFHTPQVEERKVYPTYFSDRFPSKITPGERSPFAASCSLPCLTATFVQGQVACV